MINQRRTSSIAPSPSRRFGFQTGPTTIGQPQTVNNFGFDMPMGTQKPTPLSFQPPPVPPPSTAPQVASPQDDFVAKYNAAIGNRPNRLAYQSAVEAGQPEIERGKWAKLGAIIAAGATGFGQNDASAGYNLGMSAYNEPQRKSNEKWKQKMEGLGNLATMEDTDVSARTRALELENQNKQWGAEQKIRESQETRESARSAAETEGITLDNGLKGRVVHRDVKSGIDTVIDRNGKAVYVLGQSELTPDEQTQLETARAAGKSAAELPAELARIRAQGRVNVETALAANDPRITTPENRVKGATIAITNEMRKAGIDRSLLTNDDYGMPTAIPKSMWQSKEKQNQIDALNEIIGRHMDAAESGAYDTGGGGRRSSGYGGEDEQPSNRPRYVEPGTPGAITLVSPDGERFGAKPEDVETWLSMPGVKREEEAAPAAKAPAASTTTPAEKIAATVAPPAPKPFVPPPFVNRSSTAVPGFASRPELNPFGKSLNQMPPGFTGRGPLPVPPPAPVIPETNIKVGPGIGRPEGWAPKPKTPPTQQANPIPLSKAAPDNGNPIQLANMISPAGAEKGVASAPVFKAKLGTVADAFQKLTGFTLKPVSGARTADEQAKLYAKGRSAPGNIVTNADGTVKKSAHQADEAADVRFIDKNGKEVKATKELLDTLGRIAKEQGLTWGGDWKSPYDPLHIQLNPIKK